MASKTKTKRPGVRCPRCDHAVSAVLRVLGDGRRRRQCVGCGLAYMTTETTLAGKLLPVSLSIREAIDSIPRIDAPSV